MSLKDRRVATGPYVRTVDGNRPDANGNAASSGGGGGGGAPAAHHTTHESGGTDAVTLAESQVTGLVTDLAAKAPLASPTFTGTPAAPTASQGTNTTQLATTAYVQTEAGLLIPKSLVDAKGDLLVGSADNTVIRKAVGSDGQVLTADAASTGGVKWAAPSGAAVVPSARFTGPNSGSDLTTTSASFADMTGYTASVAASVGDVLEVTLTGSMYTNVTAHNVDFRFTYNGTAAGPIWRCKPPSSLWVVPVTFTVQHVVVSGDISGGNVAVKAQWLSTSANGAFFADTSGLIGQLGVKNLGH